ncbi:MAG: Crp/Fnr family transcriptional regulator [Bacteroidia bacterium]|nr:Crp/Fnr family transcriptional regulator [Bacteroidia bacterium]
MDSFKSFLQQFPGYRPDHFEQLSPVLKIQSIRAGEYFLGQGKVCKQIAFIEEGLFRHFYLHDGKEVTTCFCREHTFLASYSSFLSQSPSDIAIQAIENSKLFLISFEAIQNLYKSDPFWQQLGRIASENEFLSSSNHQRFIHDLSATDRYLQFLASNKGLFNRIPLQYLASYLQISPETLSRIRKKIAQN